MSSIPKAMEVRFPSDTMNLPVVNATSISNLSNWPDPGSSSISGLQNVPYCFAVKIFYFTQNKFIPTISYNLHYD